MQTILIPVDEGQRFRIEKRITVVGRRKFVCNLYLPDRRVSQLHCVIRRTDDGDLVIRDLGSTNGTRINGKKVTEGLLVPGDELTFAAFTYRIETRDGGTEEPANSPAVADKPPETIRATSPPVSRNASKPATPRGDAAEQAFGASSGTSTVDSPAAAGGLKPASPAPRAPINAASPELPQSAARSEAPVNLDSSWAATQIVEEGSIHDEDFLPEPEESVTEIMRAETTVRDLIEDWPRVPGSIPPGVQSSPYRCPSCQNVFLVRAPYSWWQLPLWLLYAGVYCCPRCFRRRIRWGA